MLKQQRKVVLIIFSYWFSLSSIVTSSADLLPDDEAGNCTTGNCEQCPPDSVLSIDGECICSMDRCIRETTLLCDQDNIKELVKKGSDKPGDCCDVYECVRKPDVDCTNVTCLVEKDCPADSYRLPAHKRPGDCCSIPQGCQCLPSLPCAKVVCAPGLLSVMVQGATKKPGQCCPLYSCVQPEEAAEIHEENAVSESHPEGCISGEGKAIENGKNWLEDPCTRCTCYKGRKMCQAFMCQVSCIKPTYIPGECCPVCDGTSLQAIPAHCSPLTNCSLHCDQGFLQDDTGCITCQCQQEECVLECLDGYATDSKGKKLCKCADHPKICHSLVDCDKNCTNGYKLDSAGCQICACNGVDCDLDDDCVKHCAHGYANDDDGCPVCRCQPPEVYPQGTSVTIISKDSVCISDDGTLRDSGELWDEGCRQCYCLNGKAMCSLIHCEKPNCTNPRHDPSICCPYCQDDAVKNIPQHITCSGPNGTWFLDGEQWRIQDGCVHCICENGKVFCSSPQCPPIACKNPLPPGSGQCCPSCPFGTTFSETGDSEVRNTRCESAASNGITWKEDACISCRCDDQRTICFTESCPPLPETCSRHLLVKGKCCPTCFAEVKVANADDCYFENATYSNGQEWTIDVCTRCRCTMGHTECSQKVCSLSCTNAVKKTGKCCPSCSEDDSYSGFTLTHEIAYIIVLLVVIGASVLLTAYIMKRWRFKRQQLRLRDYNGPPLQYQYKYIPTSPPYEMPQSQKVSNQNGKYPLDSV